MGDGIENRGPQLLGINILFLTLTSIASILRCYVRARMVKAFGGDDWLMMAAMVTFVFYIACSISGVTYGTGQHHVNLEPKNIQKAKHNWWFCYLGYSATMIFSKSSIGWFLLRITTQRRDKWIVYISVFMSILTGIIFFFVTLFQCQPIDYFWNREEGQQGTCVPADVIIGLAFLYSSINVIVDFAFALLPFFLVWKLQLDKRTKITLIPILGMGCIASSALVVRLGYLMNFRDPDFLWATVDIAIWSTVEQGLAITAGSLATLRPLLKAVMSKLGITGPSYGDRNQYPGASGRRDGSRLKIEDSGSHGGGLKHKMVSLSQLGRKDKDKDIESPRTNITVTSTKDGRSSPPPYQTHATMVSRVHSSRRDMDRSWNNESQEELRDSSHDTLEHLGAGVVVTKTWLVTEREASRDGR